MAKSARVRLLAMSGIAARAITLALENGDAKTALAMFKALGVMNPPAQGEEEEMKVIFRAGSWNRRYANDNGEAK